MPYQFEEAKLSRAIRVYGTKFEFMHEELDDFGEPTGEKVLALTVKGIYHEQTSYISLTAAEAGSVQKKITPYITALAKDILEETGKPRIQQGDCTSIGPKHYKVNGVNDLSNLGIVVQVSLEEVLPDGRDSV